MNWGLPHCNGYSLTNQKMPSQTKEFVLAEYADVQASSALWYSKVMAIEFRRNHTFMLCRGSLARCFSPRGKFGLAPLRGILFNEPTNLSMHKTRMSRLTLLCNTLKLAEVVHLCFSGQFGTLLFAPRRIWVCPTGGDTF